VKALFRKGRALTCLGQYVDAEATFALAKTLNPNDAQIDQELEKVKEIVKLVRLAKAHETLKEFDEAEDALTRASYVERNNQSLYPEIDRLRELAIQEDKKGLPVIEEVLDEEPSTAYTSPRQHSATSSKPQKLDDKALQELLEKASGLRDQGGVHFKAGETHLASRSYEEAMAHLRKYEHQYRRVFYENDLEGKLCSTALATLTNLALCYLQGRPPDIDPDPTKALECCNEALELDTKNVKALFRKGKALAALGKWAQAEAEFALAADLEPKDAAIKTELERVQEFTQAQVRADQELLFRQTWDWAWRQS